MDLGSAVGAWTDRGSRSGDSIENNSSTELHYTHYYSTVVSPVTFQIIINFNALKYTQVFSSQKSYLYRDRSHYCVIVAQTLGGNMVYHISSVWTWGGLIILISFATWIWPTAESQENKKQPPTLGHAIPFIGHAFKLARNKKKFFSDSL